VLALPRKELKVDEEALRIGFVDIAALGPRPATPLTVEVCTAFRPTWLNRVTRSPSPVVPRASGRRMCHAAIRGDARYRSTSRPVRMVCIYLVARRELRTRSPNGRPAQPCPVTITRRATLATTLWPAAGRSFSGRVDPSHRPSSPQGGKPPMSRPIYLYRRDRSASQREMCSMRFAFHQHGCRAVGRRRAVLSLAVCNSCSDSLPHVTGGGPNQPDARAASARCELIHRWDSSLATSGIHEYEPTFQSP
jgi:hypothetical protein